MKQFQAIKHLNATEGATALDINTVIEKNIDDTRTSLREKVLEQKQ